MPDMLSEYTDLVTPTKADAEVAKESSRKLSKFFGKKFKSKMPMKVTFCPRNIDDVESDEVETVEIPIAAFQLLTSILTQMSMGNTLTLIPIHAELTTQEAADLLNVSRPYLIEQIEKGAIPHRMVGTHRRILFSDLMEYKKKLDESRLKAIQELVDQAQELDMGY